MTVKILGIETASEACSAALYNDGEVIECYELAPRRHNQRILPMCEQVLSEAGITLSQVDALAFGCGPGAFTGLRIAASVTQAMALAHDLPVASISTLANLAWQAEVQPGNTVLTAIDARMHEVYWAIYEIDSHGCVALMGDEKVEAPCDIKIHRSINHGAGSGWNTYHSELAEKTKLSIHAISSEILPRASATVVLGQKKYSENKMVDALNVLPVYLRNQVVQRKP